MSEQPGYVRVADTVNPKHFHLFWRNGAVTEHWQGADPRTERMIVLRRPSSSKQKAA